MTLVAIDKDALRTAFGQFASGVTVVTTCDQQGRPWGFTASAFTSLSLEPPLVLVCLQKDADCYSAFLDASSFAISVLSAGQKDVAMRFATKGANKFEETPTTLGEKTGTPLIEDAAVWIECRMHLQTDGGDHTILVGEVVEARRSGASPLVYMGRQFGTFLPESDA